MDEMINVHNGQPGAPWCMGSMTEGPAAYREPRTQDTRTLEFWGAIAKTVVSSLVSSPSSTSFHNFSFLRLSVCLSVFSLAIVLPVLALPAPFALLYFIQLAVLD